MGEFERIASITAQLRQRENVLIGPGDDAAQLATPAASVLVSTDVLVEDVHFRQAWTTPFELGRRAAAQNFADIAAMGGRPTALVVAVVAPVEAEEHWFTELARGLQAECDVVGASLIGGDLSRGELVTISVTVLGDPGLRPVTRGGAREGDVVALAGRLGWSATGLRALELGRDVDPALLAAYRVPMPPYAAGLDAAAAHATAMIDVSDGLLADAGHMADASGVTIDVDTTALVADEEVLVGARQVGASALQFVLSGGEDHALLATFGDAASVPPTFRAIGRVVSRGPDAVLVDGAPHTGPRGHDHFAEDSHG